VNLDSQQPEFFSRFERVIEVVTGDDEDRQAARARWKFYQERGYALTSYDIAGARA
jgi:DNA polymerase-3 subunit chi